MSNNRFLVYFSNIFFLTIASFFLFSCSGSVKVDNLLKTSRSWDGKKLTYPTKGLEEMSSILVSIPPKTSLPFHCHPFPTFGYMKSGSIEVEKMSGQTKTFKEGDIISEVVNSWHRGRNISALKKAEILVFYIGQKSVENTIHYSKKDRNKCRI